MTDTSVLVMGLVHSGPINIKEMLKSVDNVSKELGIDIQLVDASKVYGKEHLEIAAQKAIRAFEEGRNFGKTLAVEVLLYASGKRQISEALKFMGLHEGIHKLGAIVLSGHGKTSPQDLPRRLGLERDDKVLEGSKGVLEAFGLGPQATKGIPKDRWGDLVLEKVALLDIEK
jgi:KEOPS complex subunit Cgi121